VENNRLISMSMVPPPKVIAVDVDGTLLLAGRPNVRAIAWCRARKASGFSLFLWSMRGADYARVVAAALDIGDIFDAVISKPGYVLDDQGPAWSAHCHHITPSELP
jgi:hydroxymethylpyrimidine pyrophosphatase-like HAD family hydrolase